MKYLIMLKIFYLLIILLISPSLLAISKSESLNQDTALMDKETMFNAGTWKLYLEKCDGKSVRKLQKELPRLSWPDFKNYMTGVNRYANNYVSGACDPKETKRGADFFNWIISELTYLVDDEQTSENSNDNVLDELDNSDDDAEEKLIKLQSLFDKDLITEEEYAEKRKEILDNL